MEKVKKEKVIEDEILTEIIKKVLIDCDDCSQLKEYIATNKPSFNV